jgi:Ca-activated chloride channel family protein
MLSWQWPLVFLLLPLPWLVRALLPARNARTDGITVPHFDSIKASALATAQTSDASSRWIALASFLTWALLVASIAQPVWFADPIPVPTSGRDLMLAVDISDSMRVDDMKIGEQTLMRVDAVKSVVSDFIKARETDRIGLILFGQHTYLQVPLTFDHRAVSLQLNEALPGFAGSSTAIGDALGLAIETLRDRQADSRVLILLTDGANTSGSDPLQATAVASQAGIRVHTVGIGADGTMRTYRTGERQGRTIDLSADLDESLLETIAQETGGQFFRGTDPAEIKQIYQTISELEPSPKPKQFRPQQSLMHWPLGLAIALMALLTIAWTRKQT